MVLIFGELGATTTQLERCLKRSGGVSIEPLVELVQAARQPSRLVR